METLILADAKEAAAMAASHIAALARDAIRQRGVFCVAFSGGTTPNLLFDSLADEALPWESVHFFQVDERVAPDGHRDRNATQLRTRLLDRVSIPSLNVHLMSVNAPDLKGAAEAYGVELRQWAGTPAVLDIVHLGLGDDGHTASLAPGDDVLRVMDRDVALTSMPIKGYLRMTLTFPVINQARTVLWLVTGASKAPMLRRLVDADPRFPAGRVYQGRAMLFADRAAIPDSS